MAKVRVVIGGASFEAEGDEDACSDALRLFHLTIAEQSLRDIDAKLAELRPLQKQRRELQDEIDRLKSGR